MTPPDELLRDCPVPPWAGGDWLAVADLAEDRKRALLDCNADKAALRDHVHRTLEAFATGE